MINKLKDKLKLNHAEYRCQIPHLSIIGIVGCDKNKNVKIFIECVDDYVSVKNTEFSPNGPMKLKLRLLKGFNKPILQV